MAEGRVDTVHLTIDGVGIDVPKGTLLWEAAQQSGSDVPIFCYHSKLGPVGVCRMCLVEVEKMPKLTTACTTEVSDGMVVHTRSPEVEKAQRGVLEFLLINHPLDCPICDRGGECPLQDQTFAYGPGVSRFIERKRHFLKPIRLGPTIDLDRERCILCWRCVRFTSEIAEDNQLILTDRGSETYIDTFEGLPYDSNFSGNTVELCPVGALTSHQQRFAFRPWELRQHASVCPHCPMGCNIQIDVRDAQEVIRFRSRTNDAVDDGWLCDRGRFGHHFIGSPKRLTTPLIRRDGKLQPASWPAAYRSVAESLQRIAAQRTPDAIAGIVSPRLPNEDLFVFERFMHDVIGSRAVDYWPRPQMTLTGSQQVAAKRLWSAVAPIEKIDECGLILLIGADPTDREPVMDLRIRKAVNKFGVKLAVIGWRDVPLTSKAISVVGCEPDQLPGLIMALSMAGDFPTASPEFSTTRQLISEAEGSIVIVYDDSFPGMPLEHHGEALESIGSLMATLGSRSEVGVIPMMQTVNEMAARDFGLMAVSSDGGAWGPPVCERFVDGEIAAAFIAGANPAKEGGRLAEAIRNLEFLAVTELTMSETAEVADVVLPAASFAERVGTFTNTSRRVQAISAAVPAPGIARPDWQILVELSQRWQSPLDYSSSEQLLGAIADAIPGYRDRLPRSYSDFGMDGVSVASGNTEAAQ